MRYFDPFPDSVEVNGVKISGLMVPQIIAAFTDPDPKKWYRFERKDNMIVVETKVEP